MLRRLPWLLMLPLAFAGSWVAHLVGRAMTAGPLEGSEAAEHLERAATSHGGAAAVNVAALAAPFAAVAAVVLVARSWSKARGGAWRGARPGWFLILPALAYVTGELLERLMSGGGVAMSLHSLREPGLMPAIVLQLPFGAVAYAIARLLLAAARAIVARIRTSVPDPRRPQQIDVEPVIRIARARWSCLVGARGLRGPPVLLPS